MQRGASGGHRTAAGWPARQSGARIQTGQRLHGRLAGAEREAAGQLFDLGGKQQTHPETSSAVMVTVGIAQEKTGEHREYYSVGQNNLHNV